MSKHTPGPWVAKGAEVWGTNAMRFNLTTGGTPMIASVCKHEDADRPFPYEANARLIAAAPDLLEALKRISAIELQGFGGDWEEIEEAQDIANAEIAKVESA